jgi:hypothetical protein
VLRFYTVMKRTLFTALLSICVISFWISCGNSSETSEVATTQEVNTSLIYGDTSYRFPELSEAAKKEIFQWSVFEDFENELKFINGSNIEALQSGSERLIQHTDSLTKKIPEKLNTQAIVSRLLVVKTHASLLHQEVHKDRFENEEIENHLQTLNRATQNFVEQINGKFAKDQIDLDQQDEEAKELEKQRRLRDSIFQAEIRDSEG